MPMLLRCPVCRNEFSANDGAVGTTLRCQCGTAVRVPEPVVTAEVVDFGPGSPPSHETNSVNPYAAPQAFNAGVPPRNSLHPDWEVGIWRQGHTLVMHKAAELPDVCVKSNQPAQGRRLQRKLSWHPSWVGFTLLISPLVYVILATVLSKKATIHIGLSAPLRKRRHAILAIAWLLALGSTVLIGLALWDDLFSLGPFMVLLGFAGVVAGLLFGKYGARMVRPTQITDSHVYLRGCHAQFLARFPEWQGR